MKNDEKLGEEYSIAVYSARKISNVTSTQSWVWPCMNYEEYSIVVYYVVKITNVTL